MSGKTENIPAPSKEKLKAAKAIVKETLLNLSKSEAEEIIITEIKDKYDLSREELNNVKQYYKEEKEAKKKVEEGREKNKPNLTETDFDEEFLSGAEKEKIDELAERILCRGDPIKFILKTIENKHIGDTYTQEAICISIACQCCTNTQGIQVSVNGKSGTGKSHAVKCHLHCVPRKWRKETSLSAKSAYYMKLKPGMIIFSDDKDPDPDFQEIIKRASTNFQENTVHNTVKDQCNTELFIPARINWYLTSVESHVSDEVLNRQLTFESDTSTEQDEKVHMHQKNEAMRGENGQEINRRVLICRRIYAKLKENLFKVRIPFADRIEQADISNRRIFPLFNDMVIGYAAFKWKQRKQGEGGYLLAEEEDFRRAKKLFESRAENTITKLTEPETKIIKCIVDKKESGCTINEIVEKTEIKYQTVNRLLNGRKERNTGGLLGKVKGLKKEEVTITDYIRETDGKGHSTLIESRGRRAEKYILEYFNQWDLFSQGFITLKPEKNRIVDD